MKLIVGLGNPGEKYAGNRHNIGFMAVDEMARGYAFGPWKKRFQGYSAEGQIGAVRCILLKPATYMNESGRSVGEAMRFYKIALGDVIVVHDELDLKPGTLRVKTGGGNAGHNGLKSISAHVGNDYLRVRLGIGHPGDKTLVANYVLQDFAKADREWLVPLLEGVARGMAQLVEGGEAAFLSEAVRVQPKRAAKLNGATNSTTAAPPTVRPAIDARALIEAAAQRPIQPMTMQPIQVVAAREGGGGGAVSRAVIMPHPQPAPAPPREVTPAPPEPGPVAAKTVEQPPLDGAPLEAPVEPAPAEMMAAAVQAEENAAIEHEPAPIAAAPEPVATAVPPPKRGGLFSSWFRNRIRGGAAR